MAFEWNHPIYADIFQVAIEALVRMEKPDYSKVDLSTRDNVFWAFNSAIMSHDWFEWFSDQIKTRSGGQIQLTETDVSRFRYPVQGIALYCQISKSDTHKLVMIAPGTSPIVFEKGC